MSKFKLKWKVFAFLLGFCALLLVVLWLFQTVFLTDMYKHIRRQELRQAVLMVEQEIDNPDIQTILLYLQAENDIIVTPAHDFAPPPRLSLPPDREMPARRSFIPEAITQTEDFILQDGSTISLTFFAMITPVDATVTTLQTQLQIITVIMILLSIILAVIISRRISKPIEVVNISAKLLARGNYDTQFNGRGFLEIKELSDTLNTAAVELSKVENLRRELMANVSHDLRTPLALIYSFAEMMQDFPDEITPGQVQTIMDETKRLTSLVNNMLDISQLDTKNIELRKSSYCLTESIKSTIDTTAELIKQDGYRIDFNSDEDIYVKADELKITRAFYNLLINAVNYSGADKHITVRQSVSGGYVKIEVIDNGEGIAPDNLPYIWDRYYKADEKHKRPVMGTGLGLSIVKRIIEIHGGEYGAESEAGKGSRFWFTIRIDGPGA